ncbi:MAG: outer membrane beta-barrel protein [Bacteroidota bacterium]
MNSKKQFDHIEERIKQAAENNLPAFDEKGWQLMEAKLDNENKKRRPFLWWIVLPLLIAGAWGGYQLLKTSPSGKEIAKVVAAEKTTGKQHDKAIANPGSEKVDMVDENKNDNTVVINNDLDETNIETPENKNNSKLNTAGSRIFTGKANDGKAQLFHPGKIKGKNNGKIASQVSGGSIDDVVAGKEDAADVKSSIVKGDENAAGKPVNDVENIATNKEPVIEKPKPAVQQNADDKKLPEVAKEEVKVEKKKAEKEKDKKSNKGFYILATGGTDAGGTKLFSYSNCSIKPKYGMGVGYQFGNRISVQTGFYASSKKYVAGKADYATKPDPYWDYLTKVKATCLIYEMPLTVKVDLIRKPSFTFYGTVGSSYYIMKTEDYDYVYNYYGQEHEYAWKYTGNKHLFSTLNFSIGIEKKISNKFSLLAEPSFGMPLKGVGDGKVKLYSSALQVGLKYHFFNKQ